MLYVEILTPTLLKTSRVSSHFLQFPNGSCTFIISNEFEFFSTSVEALLGNVSFIVTVACLLFFDRFLRSASI